MVNGFSVDYKNQPITKIFIQKTKEKTQVMATEIVAQKGQLVINDSIIGIEREILLTDMYQKKKTEQKAKKISLYPGFNKNRELVNESRTTLYFKKA